MCLLVVLPQQVSAEITFEIPPYGVDVIGTVLHIVVLDKKGGSLNTIIMWPAGIYRTGPTEISVIQTSPADGIQALTRDFRWHGRYIFVDHPDQQIHLCLI